MWTAASVLSLRTPKLEFDPALPKDFDGDQSAKDSGLSMLERYVAKLLDASFVDSSLFWHYAMRHVPSPSLTCAKDYASTNYKPPGTYMQFYNDAGIPFDANNSDVMSSIPGNTMRMHGYGAFPLGGAASACFCGWDRTGADSCQIPAEVCSALQLPSCQYRMGTQAEEDALTSILNAWEARASTSSTPWSCPELDLWTLGNSL